MILYTFECSNICYLNKNAFSLACSFNSKFTNSNHIFGLVAKIPFANSNFHRLKAEGHT